MQMISIFKVCLGVMLATGQSNAGPAYKTAPPEISALCPMPPGEHPLLLPNPVDCGSFYMCSWNTAFLQQCPPKLHFNPTMQVCDYPSQANCTASTTTTTTTTLSTAPVHNTTHDLFTTPTTTTTHPPPFNTTTTYVPANNTTTTYPPPHNTTTTYAPLHNTTTTHAPLHNTTTTTHAPLHNTTTTYPPPHNTTTTYAPLHNTTTYAPLHNTTTYAPLHNTTTTHAPALNTTTSKPGIITAPPEVAAQCPPIYDIAFFIPNPEECTSFYACLPNGMAVLQHCPAGLHFNPQLQVCDYAQDAGCATTK